MAEANSSTSDLDLYSVLNISRDANQTDIKKAFHRLAKQYHPDKNPDPAAAEKMKEITFAHEILSDEEKRKIYDRYGMEGIKEGISGGRFKGMESLFEGLFGGLFGFARNDTSGPRKGKDSYIPLKVTLEDLYNGRVVQVPHKKKLRCEQCCGTGIRAEGDVEEAEEKDKENENEEGKEENENSRSGSASGSGGENEKEHEPADSAEVDTEGKRSKRKANKKRNKGRRARVPRGPRRCSECDGRGVQIGMMPIGPGFYQQVRRRCATCDGQGEIIHSSERCLACEGKKVVDREVTLEVPIERGMRNEDEIRFRGQADELPETVPGDVVVMIGCTPHSTFERIGDDLFLKQELELVEALCGCQFSVPHLAIHRVSTSTSEGSTATGERICRRALELSVMPGEVLYPGLTKVIRGEGMPLQKRPDERGDLYISFSVRFPTSNFATPEKLAELEKLLPPRPVRPLAAKDLFPPSVSKAKNKENSNVNSTSSTLEAESNTTSATSTNPESAPDPALQEIQAEIEVDFTPVHMYECDSKQVEKMRLRAKRDAAARMGPFGLFGPRFGSGLGMSDEEEEAEADERNVKGEKSNSNGARESKEKRSRRERKQEKANGDTEGDNKEEKDSEEENSDGSGSNEEDSREASPDPRAKRGQPRGASGWRSRPRPPPGEGMGMGMGADDEEVDRVMRDLLGAHEPSGPEGGEEPEEGDFEGFGMGPGAGRGTQVQCASS